MAETTTLKVLREAVADQLGLLINTAIDSAASNPVFSILGLVDKSPDAERMRDSYLYQTAVGCRRIVSVASNLQSVTISRSTAFTAAAAQIYFMLDTDEMNAAINEGLKELYFEDTESLTLVADTYTYTLPTWISQRGQILAVRWRDISLLTTIPTEEAVDSYSVLSDANALSIFINGALRSVTTYDLRVTARHNYSALATDAATTTCPYNLIFSVAMVKVLHKILNKYGKSILTLFGPKMQIAEGEMAKAKMDYLPKLTALEYVNEERWQGPDTNLFYEAPSW